MGLVNCLAVAWLGASAAFWITVATNHIPQGFCG